MKKHILKIILGISTLVLTLVVILFFKKEGQQYKQEIRPPVPANDISFE